MKMFKKNMTMTMKSHSSDDCEHISIEELYDELLKKEYALRVEISELKHQLESCKLAKNGYKNAYNAELNKNGDNR